MYLGVCRRVMVDDLTSTSPNPNFASRHDRLVNLRADGWRKEGRQRQSITMTHESRLSGVEIFSRPYDPKTKKRTDENWVPKHRLKQSRKIKNCG
jgi:hypothetical protein